MSRVRTDVDAFVGGRIKQRRKALAMSQTAICGSCKVAMS
jgi:hypothetical protein